MLACRLEWTDPAMKDCFPSKPQPSIKLTSCGQPIVLVMAIVYCMSADHVPLAVLKLEPTPIEVHDHVPEAVAGPV